MLGKYTTFDMDADRQACASLARSGAPRPSITSRKRERVVLVLLRFGCGCGLAILVGKRRHGPQYARLALRPRATRGECEEGEAAAGAREEPSFGGQRLQVVGGGAVLHQNS